MRDILQKLSGYSQKRGNLQMKKFTAIILGCIMILSSVSAFAYPGGNGNRPDNGGWNKPTTDTTTETAAEFYIQRFGAQMDEDGNVASRDASYFTTKLFDSTLTAGSRKKDYSIVYKENSVSSDDVIGEVTTKPNDTEILSKVKSLYESDGHILSSNGKVVKWENFNTEYYEIRWYVMKFEDKWHFDGVIVEKITQKPIEIPLPEDPEYTPPEELEPEEDEEIGGTPAEDEEIGKDPSEDEDLGEAVEYLSYHAYIYGFRDDIMAPDENLTRGQLAAMVHRLAKQNNNQSGFVYNESDNPVFEDTDGEWFRSGIEYINYKGAFKRQSKVYPYAEVTRGEAFKIICLGLDFSDYVNLSNEDYANLLYQGGYISGDENGNFNLSDLITRAEFCSVYNRIIGRKDAKLETADGAKITAETYGFTDLKEGKWYYEIMLRATSAYDKNGYVDLKLRNERNVLDDWQ